MITVEDFNSVLREFGGNGVYHMVDTGLLSDSEDYSDVKYDFCIIGRETTDVDEYTYSIEVVNDLWTGGYWIIDENDNYIDDATVTYSSGVLSIVSDQPAIKLFLYLSNIAHSFSLEQLSYILLNSNAQGIPYSRSITLTNPFLHFLLLDGSMPASLTMTAPNGDTGTITIIEGEDDEYYSHRVSNWYNEGSMKLTSSSGNALYFWNDVVTVKLPYYVFNEYLVKGKVNTVRMGVDVANYGISTGYVLFNDEVIPFVFSDDVFSFDLDLTKFYEDKVNLRVVVDATGLYLGGVYDLTLSCGYQQITTEEELIVECGTGGTTFVELAEDLTLTDDLLIAHDMVIHGMDYSLNLDGNSILVDGKVSVSDLSIVNGDSAFVQLADSELGLVNVSFSNCISSDYNNLGSCIRCDIDIDSLSVIDDFKTVLNECSFSNNMSCILHGGELTVNKCSFSNSDVDYVDKHNPAFLYQTDGSANIRNSIFDICYTGDDLCTLEKSIGFAQCLLRCGETAYVNGANANILSNNDALPFFDYPYSNQSHVFAKYYYPPIESCVFTSPVVNKEGKAVCYCVSDVDFVFKENVQVTRVEWESENSFNPLGE